MAKSTGLAAVALIIAIGALGLGVYQVFFVSAPTGGDSGVKNSWSDLFYTSVDTNPVSTWIPVDQLLINFTVNTGESAFFLFSTLVTVQAGTSMTLNFALDGVRLTGPPHPWWVVQATGTLIQTPISFHYTLETISAGIHNLSIHIFGGNIGNGIFASTLFAQTIIS